MANPTLTRSYAVLIVTLVAAITLWRLAVTTQDPPKLDTLASRDAVLTRPILVQHESGRASRGVYAVVSMDSGAATIDNLCFLWNCTLPPAVAALRSGDRIRIWTAATHIWQLNHEGELLLDYQQAVAAHRRSANRQEWVFGGLALALVVIIGWAAMRSRKRRAASSTLASPGAVAGKRFSLQLTKQGPARVTTTTSLTINQHKLEGPLLERFQDAALRGDREAMVAALIDGGAPEAAARQAVESLLAAPAGLGS
jgi:hypothetical protein